MNRLPLLPSFLKLINAVCYIGLSASIARFSRARRDTVFTVPMRFFALSVAAGGSSAGLRAVRGSRGVRKVAALASVLESLALGAATILTAVRLREMIRFPIGDVDVLTKVESRDAFLLALDAVLTTRSRYREPRTVALIFFDLDFFKDINDKHGHAAGDAVLQEVAQRMSRLISDRQGRLGRLGGDEFAALVTGLRERDVESLAESMRREVERPIGIGSTQAHVGVSIGIAYSKHGDDANRLLVAADKAMYEAKRRRRPHDGLATL